MNKQTIIAAVVAALFVAAVAGAWLVGFQQHQECASDWYWTGWNVGSGKAVQ